MNIFEVLSQGKSRLHEVGMSAMLGYLLDSNEDHGLRDSFVRAFLKHVGSSLFASALSVDVINSSVVLEPKYELNGSRKDIDIEINIFDAKRIETHRIIIENKIRNGAANPTQLIDYYNAILQDEPIVPNIVIVFLTPESGATQLKAEFENLNNLQEGHHKVWLFWDSLEKSSVVSMIRDVLNDEAQGKINPINEYMKHTLKAFIRHSITTVQSNVDKAMRTGEDIGEVIDEAIIKLKNGVSYRVIRRNSTQIQVINIETGDKEVAKHILGAYMNENSLNISYRDNGRINTREIGRQFFNSYSSK